MPVADADLVQSLIETGVMAEADAKKARDAQARSGGPIRDTLVGMGLAGEDQVAQAIAKIEGLEYVSLAELEISPAVIEAIPQSLAKKHSILPLEKKPGVTVIAAAEPLDFESLDNLRFMLNSDIEVAIAARDELLDAINRNYGGATVDESVDSMLQEFTDSDIGAVTEAGPSGNPDLDDDAPVVRLVRLIIEEAVRGRASDIHVEPMTDKVRIRYRVDGMCQEVQTPPKRLQGAIISRLKIMARIDIAEKRRPQDGRIFMRVDGRDIDFRVSCLPATHGESVVLRILDKQKALIGLDKLGFDPGDDGEVRPHHHAARTASSS